MAVGLSGDGNSTWLGESSLSINVVGFGSVKLIFSGFGCDDDDDDADAAVADDDVVATCDVLSTLRNGSNSSKLNVDDIESDGFSGLTWSAYDRFCISPTSSDILFSALLSENVKS